MKTFTLIVCQLVLIGIHVYGISIDNQLTVIKNDCYERLAIGEKLNPEQVYKTFEHNTVSKCEQECTREKEGCRAYSFGISAKGNATCLLGRNPIKETADLKPIGTVSDTDYDLYIKKLDCQIVLQPPASRPPSINDEHNHQSDHEAQEQHSTVSNYGNSPEQSSQYNSLSKPSHGPELGYQYNKPQSYYSDNIPGGEGMHHVQTLVSIASGPHSILHPVHDILISGDKPLKPPAGDDYATMPPFRPPALNHPYDDHRPDPPPPHDLRPIGGIFFNRIPQIGSEYDSSGSSFDHSHRPDPSSSFSHSQSSSTQSGADYGTNRPNFDYNRFPDLYQVGRPLIPPLGYGYGYGHYESQGFDFDYKDPYPDALGPTNVDRPDTNYGPRPPKLPDSGYGSGVTRLMIDRRKYESHDHFDSFHKYGIDQPKYYEPHHNFYDRYDKPNPDFPNRYGSVIPHPNDYNHTDRRHDYLYDRPLRPNGYGQRRPSAGYGRPERPIRPASDLEDQRPSFSRPNGGKPPSTSYSNPVKTSEQSSSGSRPLSTELTNHYGGVDYSNKQYGKPGEELHLKGDDGTRKIVSQSVGYRGEKITSIITELPSACFRRAMAGKRVVRSLVRKLLICDTAEQCQQECGDERRFTCEGFNYRLDPTGRGKGECELLDLPLTRIDIIREVVPDRDYDLYTRDRNAVQVNCRQPPSNNYYPGGSYQYGNEDRYYDGGNRRGDALRPFDKRPTDIGRPLRRPGDHWEDEYRGSRPRPPPALPRPPPPIESRPPPPIESRPPPPPLPPPESDRRPPDYGNRRGDYSFHHSHESHSSHSHSYHYNEHNVDRYDYHQHEDRHRPYSGIHYLPAAPSRRRPPYGTDRSDWYPKRYPVIIPLDDKYAKVPSPGDYPPSHGYYHETRVPENDHWGLDRWKWGSYGGRYGDSNRPRNNYYIPSRRQKPQISEDWGLYGGSYGTGSLSLEYQGYGNRQTYNYWGFNKFQDDTRPSYGDDFPHYQPRPGGSYLPLPSPSGGGNRYLPHHQGYDIDNKILPSELRRPFHFDLIRDECSLRSATGFRLHKGVVKKLFTVPNIYECELLCVKEKDFPCSSYAFRYTIRPNIIADNCYLSSRNYKELDYYTELEPDRDFDIYTMNNRNRCQEPGNFLGREDSDCFWRVRSGQRLDHSIVRDSLTVKSIVDCQLECLKSRRFTCRAYSFRYGSSVIGGVIDNCQLTDWPFYELDPRVHFIPESGFEVYERGSYGHGCEPNHFIIRGKHPPKDVGIKVDQFCYIGFGSAAKLLPQATVKSIHVATELDCKIECSRVREGTIFRCMTFSFVTGSPKVGHNCFLSDIMQRDLLPNVDYVHDPNSWLFTWDNYNPECVDLAYEPLHKNEGYSNKYGPDYRNPLDVWTVYSVSGWPCKRGKLCQENREAGFWYCELEGGLNSAWDYCCSPKHHCGLSNGYPYSWCYVGPSKTQWRKCNDEYYPYIHNVLDRFDSDKRPWHTSGHHAPLTQTPGYRPDRPNAPEKPQPTRPSLDQYEQQFDEEFLSPPKPGGFGQPRRWPVAYLHKEMPPNYTDTAAPQSRVEKSSDSKLSAIKSLINVIQNAEIKNIQYHISNDSNKLDDILYVKIPLPNLEDNTTTSSTQSENVFSSNTKVNFEMVDEAHVRNSRTQKSLSDVRKSYEDIRQPSFSTETVSKLSNAGKNRFPVLRRGFVTRTNVTKNRGPFGS